MFHARCKCALYITHTLGFGAIADFCTLHNSTNAMLHNVSSLQARVTSVRTACRYATIIVFFAGTMSVLTILIQGTTMPYLLSWLGVTKKTPVQIQHLLMAAKEVEEYADRNLAHLRVRCCFALLVRVTAQWQ
jgi:hypothetical protein